MNMNMNTHKESFFFSYSPLIGVFFCALAFFLFATLIFQFEEYYQDEIEQQKRDREISEFRYKEINLTLEDQLSTNSLDKTYLIMINKALENGKITRGEREEIIDYYKGTLEPELEKTALAENVRKLTETPKIIQHKDASNH